MASPYNQILSEEINLIKELNTLDCLLPRGQDSKSNYPQLFGDEQSSLFQPDQCFGQEKMWEQKNRKEKKQVQKWGQKKSKDEEIFQEYLDSLEINQFIQRQCTKSFRDQEKDKNSLECTFKPSILKKSTSIAGNLKPSFERLTNSISTKKTKTPYKPMEKTQIKKQYSKERIQRLSRPRPLKTEPAEDKQEHSFKPNLDKKSLQQMSSCFYDVATRNKLWLEQREAKVQKLRTEEEERKSLVQQNSYIPKIKNYKGQKIVPLSKYTKDGIANYFERVNMAKQRNPNVQKTNNNNNKSGRDSFIGGYSSKKIEKQSKSPIKDNAKGKNKQMKENNDSWNKNKKSGGQKTKRRYQDAVQELHEKIMKLKI